MKEEKGAGGKDMYGAMICLSSLEQTKGLNAHVESVASFFLGDSNAECARVRFVSSTVPNIHK